MASERIAQHCAELRARIARGILVEARRVRVEASRVVGDVALPDPLDPPPAPPSPVAVAEQRAHDREEREQREHHLEQR